MVSGLSMIAVLIAVRSLTDLLILFTLGAVCTSCGGLVASSKVTFLVGVMFVVGMVQAWVGQKRLKRYILRRFSNRS